MTVTAAKAFFVVMAVAWFAIRLPHEWRAMRRPIARSARSVREIIALLAAFLGMGVIPYTYILTDYLSFADYSFAPGNAIAGGGVAIAALIVFYLTHKALGSNWSATLDVRKNHRLVTRGIYRRIRHPMYTGFYLWTIAQALLLPNWLAGFSGLMGFGTLYFLRVHREEQMMLEAFGPKYQAYMRRTKRLIPWLY